MALVDREDSRMISDLGFYLNNHTIYQNGEYKRRNRFREKEN